MSTICIVVAGGVGSRFGAGRPKQLANLAGYPILHHTLRRLDLTKRFDVIVVAANPEWSDEISKIAHDAIRETQHRVVLAGDHRNESVANALESILDDEALVIVHDGVRPLVSDAVVERVIDALNDAEAVIPVIESADPILKVRRGHVVKFKSRNTHVRGQSPQGFRLSTLREAFAGSSQKQRRSVSTLFELIRLRRRGVKIAVVEGNMENIKITMRVDHMIAGQLLIGEL